MSEICHSYLAEFVSTYFPVELVSQVQILHLIPYASLSVATRRGVFGIAYCESALRIRKFKMVDPTKRMTWPFKKVPIIISKKIVSYSKKNRDRIIYHVLTKKKGLFSPACESLVRVEVRAFCAPRRGNNILYTSGGTRAFFASGQICSTSRRRANASSSEARSRAFARY